MSSPNKSDSSSKDNGLPQYKPQYTSGMTPSIITTINNTSPTPLITADQAREIDNNNRDSRLDSSPKNGAASRTVEPPYYESYIEDSFVGHWECEDDDPEYDYNRARAGFNDPHHQDEEDESMHPSTIEFDFDSFGPESFIYTPAVAAAANAAAAAATSSSSKPSETQPLPAESEVTIDVSKTQEKIEPDDKPALITPTPPVSARIEQKEEDEKKEDQDQEETSRLPAIPSSKPVNSPKICELKPSPVDYLVDPSQIDLKVIEPYKKVISHAGYCHHFDSSAPPPHPGEPPAAIIVFSACYLPDRSRRDYDYVMDHLFLYVLSSLHELIADDYILIYLHNTQPSTISSSSLSSSSHSANGSSSYSSGQEEQLHQNNLPTFTWMKRCYQMIDRKLRKNLKILYLVKPTFWLKTIVIMCRPFISSKFSKKLRFIENMDALRKCLPVDQLILPASADCL